MGTRVRPQGRTGIRRAYRAVVCGDGRVLPIVESIGRRVIREIDPASREGRDLLTSGAVALWSDAARSARRLPVKEVLGEIDARLRARIAAHRKDDRWRRHQREIARSVARSRRDLSH